MSLIDLRKGDSSQLLDALDENSVDSIITDPPYGLKFMGKEWDYDVPSVEFWKKCLRVLKPGGTALVFAGSRTQHVMATRMEEAGFILKDTMMWLYGSGFPKAMDISKNIDKRYGRFGYDLAAIKLKLKDAYDKSGKNYATIDKECGFRASGYLRIEHRDDDGWGESLPTLEKWEIIKKVIGCDEPLEKEFTEYFKEAEREVVGQGRAGFLEKNDAFELHNEGYGDYDLTKSKTNEGAVWEGWKSHSLKPAYEPIILAIKQNDGNYIENARKWGVAGLNIDETRIPIGNEQVPRMNIPYERKSDNNFGGGVDKRQGTITGHESNGRFPTNVILNHTLDCVMTSQMVKVKGQHGGERTRTFGMEGDKVSGGEGTGGTMDVPDGYAPKWKCAPHCPIRILDEQTKGKIGQGHWSQTKVTGFGATYEYSGPGERDENKEKGASRFFYCAKASRDERNIGFDVQEENKRPVGQAFGEGNAITGQSESEANFHPTVKPIELMEYLCKLTKTPTGGVVLDPFMGSGSTGIGCLLTGRDFIGMEIDEKYFNIADIRIHKFDERVWRGLFVEEEEQMGLDEWL